MYYPQHSISPTGYTLRSGGKPQQTQVFLQRRVPVGEISGLLFNRTIYKYENTGSPYAGRIVWENVMLSGPLQVGNKVDEIIFNGFSILGVLPLEQAPNGTRCSIDCLQYKE